MSPKTRANLIKVCRALVWIIYAWVAVTIVLLFLGFLLQLLGGSAAQGEGGVAFWAHVGGFVAGAALISVFKDPELVGRHRALARYV